jgi:ribosomal protein S18 acetylase RimI-like enzyme
MSVLAIRAYSEANFDALALRWHETNLASYTYVDEQQRHTLEDAREFFRTHVLGECEVWVAEEVGDLRGLIAISPGWIHQLAVFPSHQRRGIGTQLLRKAQERSPAGLQLYTFQRNSIARAFYEHHGFRVMAFGVSAHPENEPDALYRWPAEPANAAPVS